MSQFYFLNNLVHVNEVLGASYMSPPKLITLPSYFDSQEIQEISIPGTLQEDLEAAGISTDDQCRTSVDESIESLKKQRLHEEERHETKRRRDLEEQRLRREEEERRRAEEQRLRDLEEERCRKQQEEERVRKEAEERKLREEAERRQEEERRVREEEKRMREEKQKEEEAQRLREDQVRRQQEDERRRLEEQRRKEEEVRQRDEEERKKKEEAEKQRLHEIEEKKRVEKEERMKKEEEQKRPSAEEVDGSSDLQERKRKAEELRWREMEERQRPFSFKVSSGEKQILFQKVNLTPVTPAPSLQSGTGAHQKDGAKASACEDSPNLPSSPFVPHTAILVTGAQLCGTAVNLDQIKDTACKSLLGLGEDRKAQGTPPTQSKTSPDRKSGKTKSLTESSVPTDQSSAAVLAEWATIRSKIFKGVEDGKYDEYPDPSRSQLQPGSEEQPPFTHTHLRKTTSASAKFSITPAKKKFGDSNRNSELFSPDEKEAGEEITSSDSSVPASPAPPSKPQNRTSKTVRIVERGSEECMFAKDLPSFLVPSPGDKPEGGVSETEDSDCRKKGEERGQDSEDKPSPFGIKLRRTNYSLRFHSEQSVEKRKKRYSAGDSFDGVPSPLTPIEPDSDASSVFSDKSSPTSPQKEGALGKYLHTPASPAIAQTGAGKSAAAQTEGDKLLSKPLLYKRPATSPKPTGAVPTPPASPQPKEAHGAPCDASMQTSAGSDSLCHDATRRSEETTLVTQGHKSRDGQIQGDEEPKERRSFFPSINIPWREKVDRKTELIKKGDCPLTTKGLRLLKVTEV